MAKFIKLNSNGRMQEEAALVTSAGAGSAGAIPALDSNGRLDISMMPAGFGDDASTLVASEALVAGPVNIWDDGGTIKVRKADATAAGKECDAFVDQAYAADDPATVYYEGLMSGLTGLTPGARYYLNTTAGQVTTTPPTGAGNVVQYIGRAVSATDIAFEATDGVIRA